MDEIEKIDYWMQCKPSWRIYDLSDLNTIKQFKDQKVVVEAKFDGQRIEILKKHDNVEIFRNPEDLKDKAGALKNPRLPIQVKELQDMKFDNFRLDAEIVMIKDKEVLHRTATNALLEGKFDPVPVCEMAHLEVFDILEFNGKDLRTYPLHERVEILSQFKDTEHIHFIVPSINLKQDSLSYVVKASDLESLEKVAAKIKKYTFEGGAFPKFISEGFMFKTLNGVYEAPQNSTWCKLKLEFEIDGLVVKKIQVVKNGVPQKVWNYGLACGPISEEHYKAILEVNKKAAIEFNGKYYNYIGKSDNSSEEASVGDILRVSAEDVNKFETASSKYFYYKGYVMRVKEVVPEKEVPDNLDVLERLSEATSTRESFQVEEKSLKSDVALSIKNGKIPPEIYKKYAKPNQPLPPAFYPDYREGTYFTQAHIRGILPEDYEAYRKGKKSFAEIIVGHSIHLDIRADLGLPSLIQWVVTDNTVKDYIATLKGDYTKIFRGGKEVLSVHHSLAVVKPSALEPENPEPKKKDLDEVEVVKQLLLEERELEKEAGIQEAAIDLEGAKALENLIDLSRSPWLEPGTVGATKNTYSILGLLSIGKVKCGVQRQSLHEYFYYPESLNKELHNGKFIVRAFPEGTPHWQIQKAVQNLLPLDPIEHASGGAYYPVPADELKGFESGDYKYGVKGLVKKEASLDLPEFVWIPQFLSLCGSINYDIEREPRDLDIIIKGATQIDGKYYIELDRALRLKIDRALKEELSKQTGDWVLEKDTEWLESKYGPNWKSKALYSLVLRPEVKDIEIDEPDFADKCYKGTFEVVKALEEKHLVYGIVYQPEVIDAQNEWADAEEIENAAHKYLLFSRQVKVQHQAPAAAAPVESYIAPCDFTLFDRKIKKGTWILVVKVFDAELWRAIKEGKYTGFSMAGYAKEEKGVAP